MNPMLAKLIRQQAIDDATRRLKPYRGAMRESEMERGFDATVGGSRGDIADELIEAEEMEALARSARPREQAEVWSEHSPRCVLGSCWPCWSPICEVAVAVGEPCPICHNAALQTWQACLGCLRTGIDRHLPSVPRYQQPKPSAIRFKPKRTRDVWAGFEWSDKLGAATRTH